MPFRDDQVEHHRADLPLSQRALQHGDANAVHARLVKSGTDLVHSSGVLLQHHDLQIGFANQLQRETAVHRAKHEAVPSACVGQLENLIDSRREPGTAHRWRLAKRRVGEPIVERGIKPVPLALNRTSSSRAKDLVMVLPVRHEVANRHQMPHALLLPG